MNVTIRNGIIIILVIYVVIWINYITSNYITYITYIPNITSSHHYNLFQNDTLNLLLPDNSNYDHYQNQTEKNQTTTTIHDRLNRAILLHFPMESKSLFFPELKWFFRSWVEMQKYENLNWRTDILIFTSNISQDLTSLGCTYGVRLNRTEPPMCLIVLYQVLKTRNLTTTADNDENDKNLYQIQNELKNYVYIDSILSVIEGYNSFKKYDFVMRSDTDVFLAPKFGIWSHLHTLKDFHVGRGGYSTSWNSKKLKRIASYYGLQSADVENLGSTWYSTPDNVFLVANLTMFYMYQLSIDEFSTPEKNGAIGTQLWPYWHYGVLLLYGQHLTLNHLISTKRLNVTKSKFDVVSVDTSNLFENSSETPIHIHVWHGTNLFSKFKFQQNAYDNVTISDFNVNITQYYSLVLALESKRKTLEDLNRMYKAVIQEKT